MKDIVRNVHDVVHYGIDIDGATVRYGVESFLSALLHLRRELAALRGVLAGVLQIVGACA